MYYLPWILLIALGVSPIHLSTFHSYKISRLYVRHCGLMKPFVLDQFDAPELDSDTESQLNQSTKELGIHPIIGLESMEIISFIGRIWHFKNHDWKNP